MIKILLIKKGAVGDLLMATPLIRQLKQHLNCQLDILVGSSAAISLDGNINISNKFIVDDELFTIKNSYKFIKYLYALRKNRYDYVLILDKHWYFNLLAKLVGGITIGFERERVSRYLLDYAVPYNDNTKYHGVYYLELLNKINPQLVDYKDTKLDVYINEDNEAKVNNWLKSQNITDFIIVVNSGGNNAFEQNGIRMLPEAKILELLKQLCLNNENIILLGSKIDKTTYDSYITQLVANSQIINAAGQFNLAESTYLFKLAKHSYVTDCGALHLAVAADVGNHLTAIFAPTNPKHVLPFDYLIMAIWQDEDIYMPRYSLYGAKGIQHKEYFTQLNICDLVKFYKYYG